MRANLLDLDPEALAQQFAAVGEKPFRATQVLRWIHQRGAAQLAKRQRPCKQLNRATPALRQTKPSPQSTAAN